MDLEIAIGLYIKPRPLKAILCNPQGGLLETDGLNLSLVVSRLDGLSGAHAKLEVCG